MARSSFWRRVSAVCGHLPVHNGAAATASRTFAMPHSTPGAVVGGVSANTQTRAGSQVPVVQWSPSSQPAGQVTGMVVVVTVVEGRDVVVVVGARVVVGAAVVEVLVVDATV